MKLVVTAGYDRSLAATVLCERLHQSGHQIEAVMVVSVFGMKRIARLVGKGGFKALIAGLRKAKGGGVATSTPGPLQKLAAQHEVTHGSIKSWCKTRGVKRVGAANLNDSASVSRLASIQADAVVYAGGGILRKPFIEAVGGNIVNPHSGPLPQIRGMNAIEWALVLGEPLQSTVHLIDEGIDSGPILGRFDVNIEQGDSLDELRERAVVAGIEGIVELLKDKGTLEEIPKESNVLPLGTRQCFTMAPAIRKLAESRLAMRQSEGR